MKLVIAEKPQLGAIIAEAIGIISRKNGYIECKYDYCVTWAVGHILELKKPGEINSSYEEWKEEDLPLKVRPLQLKPSPDKADQFSIIESLLGKAEIVVNAGDPDDEGQLLIQEILEYTHYKGGVKRLLLNDLNVEAAKKAMQDLRDNADFQGMYKKALARSQADYLFGLNLTRAYTLAARKKGIRGVYTVGRVQTPVLGLIVRRWEANKLHKESYYYNVSGDFAFQTQKLNAKLIVTDKISTQTDDNEDKKEKRITDETIAKSIAVACKNQPATVLSSRVEEKKMAAPLPFALLDLQARANEKYGFSADDTLNITQSLREKHRAITYNRSDCRYLTTEQFEDAPKTLDFLAKHIPGLPFNNADRTQKSRAFNDKKVSAHTGIIPVVSGKSDFSLDKMTDKERKIYLEIVQQYLIQFLPDKKFDFAAVTIQCNDYEFKVTASKITDYGWSKLVPDDSGENEDHSLFLLLSQLQENNAGNCENINAQKEKTKPLPLYTDATLLRDLQRVARYVEDPTLRKVLIEKDKGREGENGGIGTPATRSSIIQNLFEREFIAYQGKKILPTQKGYDFIKALPKIITVPDTTALWFEQQLEIEQGTLSVDEFLDGIEKFIDEQIKLSSQIELELKGEKCKVCKSGVMVLRRAKESGNMFFCCSNYPNCKTFVPALGTVPIPQCPYCHGQFRVNSKAISCECGFTLWRTIAQKELTDAQILSLLTKGKTAKIKGFVSSKTDKTFEAKLVLTKDKKVSFEFVATKK
ncbi:DNA topoisomerase 3 [Bisgaard Taxon 10/6]|uniref:type IA DNA topoisomerase n=1 Tax=Exercitatus varius TaxID=67857 RepID=UPI00294B0379|nr:DNA topoisomerase 3 [Exercitatus varius]MDG2957057.1 DNA topoisomerase 3 [Exercitatus varius]MDG2965255.1 DNA topoisomerase 3 [Exercitatus varius]